MHQATLISIAVILAWTATAQNAIVPTSRVPDGLRSRDRIPKTLTLQPHSSEPAGTLDQLVNQSEAIVDATVLSSLTGEPRDTHDPVLFTKHQIAINRVFRGERLAPSERIFVYQIGGKTSEREVILSGVPLMQTGQRFILFLSPKNAAGRTGEDEQKYYAVVGGGVGIFRIENGRMRVLPVHDEPLNQIDGRSFNDFESTVLDLVDHRIIPPSRNKLPHPQGAAAKAPGK